MILLILKTEKLKHESIAQNQKRLATPALEYQEQQIKLSQFH